MGYYHQFPNAIPRSEVRCVRVTHPSAGVLLPLDLHVLGLPLAFILSQDQTLHRIVFSAEAPLCFYDRGYLNPKPGLIPISNFLQN
jgi:hypothetical protein